MITNPDTNAVSISKETIHRLLKDVRQIMKSPLIDNGIYYVHDDEDILKGYAMIVGPSDTPYFSGFYFFKLQYTADYPYSPPVVTYHTNDGNVRFNPNLYTNGKVCVSILNTWRGEQWSSCQTITTILLTLCTLFIKNPIVNEPGLTMSNPDCEPYNSIIRYSNINIAICDMIQQKTIFLPEFKVFYPYMKEHFLKNYDSILAIILKEKNKNIPSFVMNTRVYSMNILIDYAKLYNKFIDCENICKQN
jgi:ubiquitin-protein ligase